MASENEIQKIIEQAIIDEAFRTKLMDDPVKAIKSVGYELSDAQIEQLTSMHTTQIESMIVEIEDRFSKAANPAAAVAMCWG
jgi:flagellar basal body-associated protein FliL